MPNRSSRRSARPVPVRTLAIWLTIGIVTIGILVAVGLTNRMVPQAATDATPNSSIANGDPAPEFSAETTQGNFALSSAGRPVFLEVFATWCPHCQRETVVLNRLYEKYKGRVDFVAVTGSPFGSDRATPESEADVLAFARYFNVQYPVAFDGSLDVAKSYLKGGYPTIVLIGTDKRVKFIGSGEVPEPVLDSKIRRLS
jgi:cytochrome c biogenesis protein CcmG, thiol:disulfide interchange protein DsbE